MLPLRLGGRRDGHIINKNTMNKIELGDLVKDKITGFKGVAIGRTTWLFGCDRISVQPQGLKKEGGTYEVQSFDEPQLEVVKKAKTKDKAENHKTGGPNREPSMPRHKN